MRKEIVKVYYSKELKEKFISKLKEELGRKFINCKTIAIKMHFGEPGNKTSFKPEQIKPITNILKELKINYFLYDSSVAYNSPRNNPDSHKKAAVERGWGELGEIKTDDNFILIKGKNLEYEVSKSLAEADGVLVISHFKGHFCCGFGGAIKNLGMGALTKKTKSEIHAGGKPNVSKVKGKCTQCKACENACPLDGIKVTDKPNITKCYGCSNCCYVCPNGVLTPKVDYFDNLLAGGANAAQSSFKNFYYVSFLTNITEDCDCEEDSGKIIADNSGYLMSEDAVSIDQASRDLVIKKAGKDVFKEFNKKSGLEQIKAAENVGMGSSKYKLVEIN